MVKIEKDSSDPLYYQLFNIIKNKINTGDYREDDKLSSERELSHIYKISRSTVRQAIKRLEDEELVYTIQGRGTFVSGKRLKQDLLKFYSFTDEMKELGKKPFSKVLNFDLIDSPEDISKKMCLEDDERVYIFTRLRLADGIPMMFETTYLPYDRFKNLSKEMLEGFPMYDVFRDEYDVGFTRAEEILQPVLIRESESQILDCPTKTASMMIERITYEDEDIIEYTKSIARGDKFKYRVKLEK